MFVYEDFYNLGEPWVRKQKVEIIKVTSCLSGNVTVVIFKEQARVLRAFGNDGLEAPRSPIPKPPINSDGWS